MNRFPPCYGLREPDLDPEAAAEAYWSPMNAAYEQWRDDQILARIESYPPPEHERNDQP